MNRINFLQPILFDHLLDTFKISKSRIALIALFALSCLALAYAMCRWMHFKADASEETLPDESSERLPQLRKGHTIIPFLPEEKMDQHFDKLKDFHAKPDAYKTQFSEKEVEFGYAALKGKQVFVIRNQKVPEELKNFLPYIAEVHAKALEILKSIEQDLKLETGTLTESVSKTPFPEEKKSSSLLRLFAYDPSIEEGSAADAHEDLGLLTIIPRSPVPALEVIDFEEDCNWINLEQKANPSEAIVLVGRTLEKMTQGKYQAAPHRVKKSELKRFSIVYQLRAEPDFKITHENQEITVGEWLQKLKANLTSVNGSY